MWWATAALLIFQLPPATIQKQAYRAYQSREWATAARLYEEFHASSAGTASTYDNLGVALTNLGQWSKAASALEKAIALDPRHRWAYNHLGFVYREQGRYQDAVRTFRRQIDISPQDPYAYRNLAGVLALLGRLEEADQVAAAHEQRTYERGSVYIDMACNLNPLNQPEQAKRYLQKARDAGAERGLLAQEWAHYFLTLRDYRRAELEYLKLLQYQPYEPTVALRLGMLYFNTGNLEKAAAAFARVMAVDQSDQVTIRTSANTSRTVALSELSGSPGAGARVLGDLPVDPGRAALLVRLERYRKPPADADRLRGACQDFLERLRGAPHAEAEAWVRDTLGWLRFEAGQIPAARAELERAIAAAPDRRMTAYHLAVVLEKSGETERALTLYIRSLQPQPETAIDCGCELPGVAAREKIARALYARLRGEESGFEAYRTAVNNR